VGRVHLPDTILARLAAEGRIPPGTGSPEPRAARSVGGRRVEDWPGELAGQARAAGLALPIREYRFHPARRWRFDLAWPIPRVAVEVDGGAYIGGRHTSGPGFEADCEKHSVAASQGWRVLRVTPRHIRQGKALDWLTEAILGGPPWPPAP
jgi:very-short-patch-repair endonuclease